jgi:hypothetical protein
MCLIIHPSCHGLFIPTGRRNSEIQTWHNGQMYHQIHTQLCIKHEVQTCALGTGCIHLSRHPFVHPSDHPSVPAWSVYFDEAEKEWNQHPPTHQLVILSMGWAAFLHLALITQLFLVFDQWVFFGLFFFLNPDLHTTFSPRIKYKWRGKERKKNRRKDPDKLRVVESQVKLIAIKWRNWHSKKISLHN